jgi:protein-S-isoprenylcysteine O-methyltransferase Ste14
MADRRMTAAAPQPAAGTMRSALIRVTVDAVVVAVVLFTAAGTLAWPRAWLLLAVLLAVRVVTAIAVFGVNPALVRDRATVLSHNDQPPADRLLLPAYMILGFLGVPAVAAVDVFRLHFFPQPPVAIAIAGLVMYTLGWMIAALALRANAFAVTVVRVQHERQHRVVDAGIYSFVRHPMYSASPLVHVGLSLWLGSFAAAIFSVVPLALLAMRIRIEERLLRRELPGYDEYASRVPFRVLPGIW